MGRQPAGRVIIPQRPAALLSPAGPPARWGRGVTGKSRMHAQVPWKYVSRFWTPLAGGEHVLSSTKTLEAGDAPE